MSNSRTISDIFDHVCTRNETRVALRDGSVSISFGRLLQRSQAISRALEPAMAEPGQRVALIAPNSSAFVAAFYGIVRSGGVVAPLHPAYRSQELVYYLNDLDAVAVVAEPRFLERVSQLLPSLGTAPALLELSGTLDVRVVQRGVGIGEAARTVTSSPLLQLYTSGSTGVAKRVVRTHADLLAELDALTRMFGVSEQDRFLGVTPFSHVNGLVRTMLTAMHAGGTLYPVEEFQRRAVLDHIARERITFFAGVPQMFAILSHTPSRGEVDLSSLRVVFSSSAPLLPVDNRRFQSRYGVFVRQLYGSTETGSISFNRHPCPESCLQSVGTPIDGVRVDVVDEQGRLLPPGREGEIVIASPFAASEYLGNPVATQESFRDGLYFSGDLGVKDQGGYLTITGRRKLLINRGGFKVNPFEVEEVLRQHPKVSEAAVFGTPGDYGDDIVCCAIVSSEPCTAEEIVSHCRDRIADFKIPARIDFRKALPTGPMGKILRGKL